MLTTLSGIVMLLRLVDLENALSPMAMTGKSLVPKGITVGMVTDPFVPVYPVIVAKPLALV